MVTNGQPAQELVAVDVPEVGGRHPAGRTAAIHLCFGELGGHVRGERRLVTEPLEELSVPNEAIIEADGHSVVYVEADKGRYVPREIQPGLQGERYTQITKGLQAGERVVTFGSFFIDADYKLKGF